MEKSKQVGELVREGQTPTEIAETLGIAFSSVLSYLHRAVGAGYVRRSDVYFSLPSEVRAAPKGDDAIIVQQFGSPAHALGDMYDELRSIEASLHKLIRQTLVDHFGPEESEWWWEGIPENIRRKCAERRQEDTGPRYEEYGYTDVLDLAAIIRTRWTIASPHLGGYASDKPRFLKDMQRLGQIRNLVMHPVRGDFPTEDDYAFLRELRIRLEA